MKSIIVTGITRGLGRAVHDGLLGPGFAADQKIFVSRGIESWVPPDASVQYVNHDLADEAWDPSPMVIDPRARGLIFVSNAAALGPITRATQASGADLHHALQVNVVAPLRIAQYLTTVAEARQIPLKILDVSSGAASRPIQGWLHYCVGKAAAVMALDVLAAENPLVEVLHFNPGVMDTGMQATIRAASEQDMPEVEQYRQLKTGGALKPPEQVAAEVCAWLQQV